MMCDETPQLDHHFNQTATRQAVPRRRRKAGTALGFVLVISMLFWGQVSAASGEAPFGYDPSNGIYFTDNSTLTHRSTECTQADFLHFNYYMHYSYTLDYDPTHLNTVELTPGCNSEQSQDDNYWYATAGALLSSPGATGDWKCRWVNWVFCNRGRIRLKQEMRTDGTSEGTKWNTACHEIAHGVGFFHGTAGNNCMDGGNNGILDSYMINKIDSVY